MSDQFNRWKLVSDCMDTMKTRVFYREAADEDWIEIENVCRVDFIHDAADHKPRMILTIVGCDVEIFANDPLILARNP